MFSSVPRGNQQLDLVQQARLHPDVLVCPHSLTLFCLLAVVSAYHRTARICATQQILDAAQTDSLQSAPRGAGWGIRERFFVACDTLRKSGLLDRSASPKRVSELPSLQAVGDALVRDTAYFHGDQVIIARDPGKELRVWCDDNGVDILAPRAVLLSAVQVTPTVLREVLTTHQEFLAMPQGWYREMILRLCDGNLEGLENFV